MSQWLPVVSDWHISREQFGLNLYAAVRCCGAILQITDQLAMPEQTELQQRPYAAAMIVEKAHLAHALKTLSDAETGQLLRHYPWIPKL